MKRERKEKFIKQPHYPGGMKALSEFISSQMVYPADALQDKLEGTVHLRYSIDRQGKPFDVKVISGISSSCNEEARRLVQLLRFKMPKNRAGKIIFHKTLQIHFKLPKKEVKPQKTEERQVEYSYTMTKPKKETNGLKKGTSSGYNYTISF